MIQHRAVAHVDLPLLQQGRHRHHHRELVGLAAVIVRHREHGAVPVAHHHHLGSVIEELRVASRDVEAAETKRWGGPGQGDPEQAAGEKKALHRGLLWVEVPFAHDSIRNVVRAA